MNIGPRAAFFALNFALLLPAARPAGAFYSGQPPAFVLGQTTWTATSDNQGLSVAGNTLKHPRDVFSDGTRLFIADSDNNRVLIYNTIPSSTNASADIVVGQPNLSASDVNQGLASPTGQTLRGPEGVFFDGTKLYISDTGNHRILIYNTLPTGHNATANVAVGQADLITGLKNQNGSSNATGQGMNEPSKVSVAGGKLFVADLSNNRVLIYNTVPVAHNAAADIALGQTSLQTSAQATSQSGFFLPSHAIVSGAKLIVSDAGNNRVMIYNTVPTTHTALADNVLGQSNFTTASAGNSSNAMDFPFGLLVQNGRLFVSQWDNTDVTMYGSIPTQDNANPEVVIGKDGFYAGRIGPKPVSMGPALGITYAAGKLFVAERHLNRIVAYSDDFGAYFATRPTTLNLGTTSFAILGDGLIPNSSVYLFLSPSTTIQASAAVITSTAITADFNLFGAAEGEYSLRITTGGQSFLLTRFVTVNSFRTTQVIPNFGYNNTVLSFTLIGSNFLAGSTVALRRNGETDIRATSVVVVSSAEVTGSFDLRQKKVGLWSIIVTSGSLANNFSNGYLVTKLPQLSIDVEKSGSLTSTGGDLLLDNSSNGLIGTILSVPSGAIEVNLTVNISIGAVKTPPPLPPGLKAFKTPIDLAPSGMQFLSDFSLKVPYTAAELRAFGISSPSLLRAYTYNPDTQIWESVSITPDTANNLVVLNTNHFSIYTVAAPAATDFSTVKVFPNPYRPDLGHSSIQIINLPIPSKLTLFSPGGAKIRDLGETQTGATSWDGKNDSGRSVASGVYLLLIRNGSDSTTRKVVIER